MPSLVVSEHALFSFACMGVSCMWEQQSARMRVSCMWEQQSPCVTTGVSHLQRFLQKNKALNVDPYNNIGKRDVVKAVASRDLHGQHNDNHINVSRVLLLRQQHLRNGSNVFKYLTWPKNELPTKRTCFLL